MSVDAQTTTMNEVRDVLEAALPGVGIESLQPLDAGYSSNHWVADTDDGRLLVKIPQRNRDPEHLRRLIRNTELAQEHGIPVVRYRCLVPHAPSVGGPVLIQEFHEGDSAADVWDSLDEGGRAALCEDLGDLVGRMHSITGPEFGPLLGGGTAGTLHEAIEAELDTLLAQADADALGGDCADALRAAVAAELSHIDDAGSRPALVHGDLWLPNFLVGGGRITRVLDFEHAVFADRFRDFGKLEEHVFAKYPAARGPFLKAYGEACPLPSDWERRVDLARVLHALAMHVYFLQWTPQFAPEYAGQVGEWLAKRS